MEEKILDLSYRKKVIDEIKGDENVKRKVKSYKKQNMQRDNFYQYVKEELEQRLDPQTVKEMHIFANINLQKRISKTEASVYKHEPERKFFAGENEIVGLDDIYESMDINTVFRRANEAYKYEDQCAIQVYPDEQKLKARVLLPHHFDVVPNPKDPEKVMAYIISNFDNTSRDRIRKENQGNNYSQGETYRDQINQEIGDVDDQKLRHERFYWWSKSFNFVTDGNGNILDKITEQELPIDMELELGDPNITSPLEEYSILPFIDISQPKDFEYWIRGGDALFQTTIMYNLILSSEFKTNQLQGHAQAFYKGSADHMPESLRVGVDKLIFIPIDPNAEAGGSGEFGFANPGSDLAGIRKFRESFLSAFLSSRGLDASVVSGDSTVQTASSGIEKMLQMVEKFEASQEDFSLFRTAEIQLLEVISSWIKSLDGETIDGQPMLTEEFSITIPEPKEISIYVEFSKPELIKTEMDLLEVAEKEIEIGVSSRVHYLIDHKGMSKEQAVKHLEEVEEFESIRGILPVTIPEVE